MATWIPDRLTPEQLAARRHAAAALFRAGGRSQAAIARQLGVTPAAVSRWRRRWRHGGDGRLAARPKPGRPPRLTPRQWQRLARLLERGALAAGFATERWTRRRIAAVIARVFGVRYHPHALARPLQAHGFTPHRPAARARERDEYLIAQWPTREWVALKKKARRAHRTLVLVDETGHTFQARTAPTWARRGVTPVLRRRSQRREVSSVVGVTPDGRLAARHFPGAIDSRKVITAVRHFQRRFGPRLLLVWDRLQAHRARQTQRFLAREPALAVAYLPAYAPELNPEEQCNAWVKGRMANALPASVGELTALARRSFGRLQRRPAMITGFFHHAGL